MSGIGTAVAAYQSFAAAVQRLNGKEKKYLEKLMRKMMNLRLSTEKKNEMRGSL